MVRLSVSAYCAATAAGAKLPFDLESSNQLSQRAEEPEEPDHLLCMAVARLFGVEWRREESGRVADVWLEMNSIPDKAHCPHFRPSFSSLVGRTNRAPPSSFSFLPFCAAAAAGFSWAWEFTDLHIGRSPKTLFFGDRDFALHHPMQMSSRLSLAFVSLVEWDGGAIIFRRGFIFPLPSRCDIDIAGAGDNDWGEMGVPLHPSQNQCVRTETLLI